MHLIFLNAAATKVKEILTEENAGKEETSLRVFVKGGGCSGFQYGFSFDSKNEEDVEVITNGVALIVDPVSLQYLNGSEIDYTSDDFSSQFVIHNPNVQATCGCGSSFAVT